METAAQNPASGWLPFAAIGMLAGVVLGAILLFGRGTEGGPPEAENGAVQYALTCARCHGARGEGVPPFKPLAGKQRTLEQIEQRIREGGDGMPTFGYLSSARRRAIAEHVQRLGSGR